jgi:hypothetical protein
MVVPPHSGNATIQGNARSRAAESKFRYAIPCSTYSSGCKTRPIAGAGYAVITASNGMDALSVAGFRRARFDLMVTDMLTPEMEGGSLRTGWLQFALA